MSSKIGFDNAYAPALQTAFTALFPKYAEKTLEQKIRNYLISQTESSEDIEEADKLKKIKLYESEDFPLSSDIIKDLSTKLLHRNDAFLGLLKSAPLEQTTLKNYLAYLERKDKTKTEISTFLLYEIYAAVEKNNKNRQPAATIGHMRRQAVMRKMGMTEPGKSDVDMINDLSFELKSTHAKDIKKIVLDNMKTALPDEIGQRLTSGGVTIEELLSYL